MARRETTAVILNENGSETHPSWILMRANTVSCSPPGEDMFGSEISHQSYVMVTATRVERTRSHNRDWLFPRGVIFEARMSKAGWGEFVSSFGDGTGVPVTLEYLAGEQMPNAPRERRLDESHREVRDAGKDALAEVMAAAKALKEAYDGKAGRRELTPLVDTLMNRLGNAPANMEFAAKSLTEHVETVVKKARADVEGMVLNALANNGATELPEGTSLPIIEIGTPTDG